MGRTRTDRLLSAPMAALTAMAFLLGCGEFIMVGILPDIAASLHGDLESVGRLVSVYAVCYAAGTPLIMAATARVPRRRLLAVLSVLFSAACGGCMLAANVAMLAAARIAAALLSGPLTALLMLFARQVSGPDRAARGIAMIYTGFSVATVAGVPLGTALSRTVSWRAVFGAILLLTLGILPALLRLIPHRQEEPMPPTGLLRQFSVVGDRRFSLCLLMILCSAAATYVVYTFLTPILTDVLGLSGAVVSPLLAAVGLCCAAGNLLSGKLGERGGLRALPLVFGAQAVLFALLPALLRSTGSGVAGLLVMALLMYILNTPVQLHFLDLAEREYPCAVGLCATMQPVSFNLGIALGSFVGSGFQARAGLLPLGLVSVIFALGAFGLCMLLLGAVSGAGRRGAHRPTPSKN